MRELLQAARASKGSLWLCTVQHESVQVNPSFGVIPVPTGPDPDRHGGVSIVL